MIWDVYIRYTWKQEAPTWPCAVWHLFKFALSCLLIAILVDTVMAVVIFLQYRTAEAYVQMDPHAFQLHKTRTEITYTLLGCLVPWCYCFIVTFLDISFRSERNSPTKSAPVISPTAPASTASITAIDAPLQTEPEPIVYSDSRAPVISPTAPASTASITAIDAPLQTEPEPIVYSDSRAPVNTRAADVVDPFLLGTGTAASGPSWVGAPENSLSARAIDHRLDAASVTTGKDSGTRSERDRSLNDIEGDDDKSDSTEEVLPLICTPRLEMERSDHRVGPWSAFKMIDHIAGQTSAASPALKTSAAVGFRSYNNNWIRPIRAGSGIETPLPLLSAASSQAIEQASADFGHEMSTTPSRLPPKRSHRQQIEHKSLKGARLREYPTSPYRNLGSPTTPSRIPPKRSHRRQIEHKSPKGARLREYPTSPYRNLGSPPAMRWPHSNLEALNEPTAIVSPQRSLPLYDFPPASSPNNEDLSWEASSRPVTPVRRAIFSSPGSRAYRNIVFNNSRVTYKELLLRKMQDWRPTDNLQKLKDLMYYEDEDDFRYTLDEIEIVRERKRYELYAREKKICRSRAFHIYGTKELFELDCLKSWVKLFMHLDPLTPFPPGYRVITNESDTVSMTGTLFTQSSQSQESDDYESTASESSKGKGKMK